jgi:hypothetical protein
VRGPRKDSQLRAGRHDRYIMTQITHVLGPVLIYDPTIMGKKNLNPADAYRKYSSHFRNHARTHSNTEGKALRKKELKKAFTSIIKFIITRSDHSFCSRTRLRDRKHAILHL